MTHIALLILVLIINISSIYSADHTCPVGQDCIIPSNTSQNFDESTIICPDNYECDISCIDISCQNAKILASTSTKLIFKCQGLDNCKNITVLGSNINTTIDCDGTTVCEMAKFNLNSTAFASIHCDSDGSCHSMEVDAESSNELYINYNTINAGDDSTIYCGDICVISTINTQLNINIYSESTLYGNILQCDTSNCFPDTQIYCNDNFNTTCNVAYDSIYDEYSCDLCLNPVFSEHEFTFSIDYSTNEMDSTRYRINLQQILDGAVKYILTDVGDQYYSAIVESDCDCIDNLDDYLSVLITDTFISSNERRRNLLQTDYTMEITASSSSSVLIDQLALIIESSRFSFLFPDRMREFDDTFTVNSIDYNTPSTTTTTTAAEDDGDPADDAVMVYIFWVVVGILILITIIAVIGTIQMYYYDVTIYVTGILLMGLYTWDFYSDILFSYEVFNSFSAATDENTETWLLVLFIGCLLFLVLPIITSIWSLFRFQDKWTKDPAIGEHVMGWNRDWSTYLLFITVLSGSSFAAVNLFNSRVFGHPLFCMGLSYRHLKKFENQRLWGVILSENIPQVIIQGLFYWKNGAEATLVLILAFVSSVLSIIVALIDIYNNKRLFGQFSKGHDSQTICKVPVISPEVADMQWKLCLATHRFNTIFAQITSIDKHAFEVDLPSPHTNGLIINFSIRTVDRSPKQISDAMIKARNNGQMAKLIKEAWKLEKPPILGAITFQQIGKNIDEFTIDVPSENLNPLSTDAKKLEENMSDEAASPHSLKSTTSLKRERTNTVEAKPYDQLDKATKAKIKEERRLRESESAQAVKAATPTPTEKSTFIKKFDSVQSHSPQSMPAKSGSVDLEPRGLPKQKTGQNLKRMKQIIEMTQQQKREQDMKAMTDQLVASGSTADLVGQKLSTSAVSAQPKTMVGMQAKQMLDYANNGGGNIHDPQSQFRQYVQQNGAPSVPQLYGNQNNSYPVQQQQGMGYSQSSMNLNYNNNMNEMQAGYNQNNMGMQPQNNYHHNHAATYTQMPYNYQQVHQLPTDQMGNYNDPQMNYNDAQMQFQQNYAVQQQQYAASAMNLNANPMDYNDYDGNMQQQFQQNPQLHYASMNNVYNNNYNQFNQHQQYGQNIEQINEDEEVDHDHAGFVPPAPHQEIDKFVKYKQKRAMLDHEKKVRQEKEREAKRREKMKSGKIESPKTHELQPSQWSNNNGNDYQYQQQQQQMYNNNGYNGQQFSQNLGHHGMQEGNNMDNIVNEMNNQSQYGYAD